MKRRKQQKGIVAAYLTQKQAMRRLQLTLPIFRRLCIVKGIYPVEPKNKNKAGKGNSQPRIYFNTKDITFLAREPLIEKFRKLRVYHLKVKKAKERKDAGREFKARIRKPQYSLHEIVKERYPSRQDALNDISDSLNLIFLFSRLPRLPHFSHSLIAISRRLSIEFMNFVIATQAVRKGFVSIKGFYVEAEVDGISVVWTIPHPSVTHAPSSVDYRILANCLEFDLTLVGSLMCHLYRLSGLVYPPKPIAKLEASLDSLNFGLLSSFETLSCLSYPLKRTEEQTSSDLPTGDLEELQRIDEQVSQAVSKQLEVTRIQTLFKGKRFFLNREVPREVLCLIVRSCGGDCSWDSRTCPGATFTEDDVSVDYQVVDRPMTDMSITRSYVQPQWIFDCLNAVRMLPARDYLPGVNLPSHLSPFAVASQEPHASQRGGFTGVAVGYGEGALSYRPPEADYLAGLVNLAQIRGPKRPVAQADDYAAEEVALSDEEMLASEEQTNDNTHGRQASKSGRGQVKVVPGSVENKTAKANEEKATKNTERKMREILLPKKQKNAYKKMVYSVKRKNKEERQLTERRQAIDKKAVASSR